MSRIKYLLPIIGIIVTLIACEEEETPGVGPGDGPALGPRQVQVHKTNGIWRLYRDGGLFTIKGVAANNYFAEAGEFGANTIRLYGINDSTRAIMDLAHENGLAVCLGLSVGKERFGFDYTDETAVREQLDRLKSDVKAFKDHPALLLWYVGNEIDAEYATLKNKQELWEAVNEICEMIHQEDPDHPTTTAIVNSSVEKLTDIKTWAPALDIISSNAKHIQSDNVIGNLTTAGWEKPYILSEFGIRNRPQGIPEAPGLEWGAVTEPTSTEKALLMRRIYESDVLPNIPKGCIGSFAFLWGDQAFNARGTTKNWFAIFNEEGRTYGIADELQFGWLGYYPTNRAPRIESRSGMTLNEQIADDGVKLSLGSTHTGRVTASDTDPLTYQWVIVPENAIAGNRPPGLSHWIVSENGPQVTFKCLTAGEFRLYVFVKDNQNKVANAVIPFLVE